MDLNCFGGIEFACFNNTAFLPLTSSEVDGQKFIRVTLRLKNSIPLPQDHYYKNES